jgi:hypothetical protein
MAHNVQAQVENLVAHHRHNLLIAHKVDHNVQAQVENQVAVDLHLEDPARVPALVAHLEKMQARKRITRVRKLAVKKSTICKRQHWAAQLFLAVMAILQSVFAEEHRLLILPKKSVQIPQL